MMDTQDPLCISQNALLSPRRSPHRHRPLGLVVGLAALMAGAMGVNDDGACGSTLAVPDTIDTARACETPRDCTDVLPCPGGVGAWSCTADRCQAECESAPNPADLCTSSAMCDTGTHCSVEDGDCQSNCPAGATCPDVCWGSCVADPKGCLSDGDCALGQFCDFSGALADPRALVAPEGVCKAHEACEVDSDCPTHQQCRCAAYPPGTPPNAMMPCFLQCLPRGDACTRDADCASGQQCIDGACLPTTPDELCMSSDTCAAGQHCSTEDGACLSNCPAGMNCPAVCWGLCVQDVPPCYRDADCAPGSFCDFSGSFTDPSALVAPAGTCRERASCQSDSECARDEVCRCAAYPQADAAGAPVPCQQQCLPRDPPCAANSDCPAGEQCIDGACAPPPETCVNNDECPAGWECASTCPGTYPDPTARRACPSVCVPPRGACANDADCAEGTHCEETCRSECAAPYCPDGATCDPPQCPETCTSACVPDEPTSCQTDRDCPEATHCGCAGTGIPPLPSGLVICPLQCIPDDIDPAGCFSDADCHAGDVCNFDACGGAGECDPASQSCANRPAPSCPGVCVAASGPLTCTSDSDCIRPDGEQGTCEVIVCADATPCQGDNCGAFMPPAPTDCAGVCHFDSPSTCDPADADACGQGQTCEVVGCGGTPGSSEAAMRPCVPVYGCVPSEATCTDDCDCQDGTTCERGSCVTAARDNTCGATSCTRDSDCSDGRVCVIDGTNLVCPELPSTDVCAEVPYGHCAAPQDPTGDCVISGCSAQICAAQPMMSDCMYRPWYVCYQDAACGRNAAGTCGWELDAELIRCLAAHGAPSATP